MRKFSILFSMFLMATLAFFTSCTPDDNGTPPSLSFVGGYTNGQTVTIDQGNSIVVKWIANKGTSNLNTFSVIKDGSMYANYNSGSPRTLSGGNRDTYQDSVTISLPGTYEFKVTDTEGESRSITLIVQTQNDPGVDEWSTVLVGAQNNATTGSFYDAEGNTVYLIAGAKTNATVIDFVYFYGATNLATIAAPNDADAATIYNSSTTGLATWSVRNATKFKTTTLTAAEFNGIVTSAEVASQASDAAATKVNMLSSGDVFAFTTVNGKSGLVLVENLTATNNGTITLRVKIQK